MARDRDNDDEFAEETRAVPVDGWGQQPVKPEEPYLIVLSGRHIGSMVKVEQEVVVGRSSDAGLQIQDDGVSRHHLQLVRSQAGQVVARDMGSRNGSFVNNERISEVVLKDGDKIRVGSTTILKFSYQDTLDESFQQEMYDAALRDPLTQLYNRKYFTEQVEAEFAFAQRHRVPLCLILFDVDHFKRVNDTHGHSIGDSVLSGLAKAFTQLTRREDLPARYGGEEFVLLCRATPSSAGLAVAERIRIHVGQARLVPELPDLVVTVSAGVAAMPDIGIGNVQMLIDAADKAMYQAKELGRNRVCLHSPAP
jgi:two-component system, cell cycle response regulator